MISKLYCTYRKSHPAMSLLSVKKKRKQKEKKNEKRENQKRTLTPTFTTAKQTKPKTTLTIYISPAAQT